MNSLTNRLHQAGAVGVQNSERRVVLKCCEHTGARIVPLVYNPHYCRYCHDSHHAEDDQAGQQSARFWKGTSDNAKEGREEVNKLLPPDKPNRSCTSSTKTLATNDRERGFVFRDSMTAQPRWHNTLQGTVGTHLPRQGLLPDAPIHPPYAILPDAPHSPCPGHQTCTAKVQLALKREKRRENNVKGLALDRFLEVDPKEHYETVSPEGTRAHLYKTRRLEEPSTSDPPSAARSSALIGRGRVKAEVYRARGFPEGSSQLNWAM
ncbi:hypothetical protein EYF80_005246 [Liparis tanakae]|uniref:Uncharacterized protein n=1 Tax=Liparis tanakae TaxID=230148 RepID=A0A4Z2J2Y5_9TELE|nr:hypothetical protein EYF80_005246 [Liparis tanakae]